MATHVGIVPEEVFKDKFNKKGFDRTVWYSMPEHLLKRALEKKGKVWFDVSVAMRCHSIIAGTLYQNLRYHLLCLSRLSAELHW